jgi:ribose transport system permease protein
MKKNMGIFILLVVVIAITAWKSPYFLTAYNVQNTIFWTSIYGFISIGVAFVIVTGGIDLSIGSVIGLIGCLLPWLTQTHHWSIALAIPVVMLLAVLLGLFHGLLITKLNLRPFIVTLCGLLIYRGLARFITGDATQGYGIDFPKIKALVAGTALHTITGKTYSFDLPNVCVLVLIIALLAAFFLNRTIWGRYLLALGRNEEAAKFSGIRTDRMIVVAYIISATLAGLTGVLLSLDLNSVQPSGFGNFYELYAIAAAVLGGCSLRGGEGSILGLIIGTALMRVLYNSINMLNIPTQLDFAVIGTVILVGVSVDEVVRKIAAQRKRVRGFEVIAAQPKPSV